MKKGIFICFHCVVFHFSGYSQEDSTRIFPKDSFPGNNVLMNADTSGKQALIPGKDSRKKKEVYILKPGVDIPIVAIGTTWSLFALSKIEVKSSSSVEEIQNLKRDDINKFDRWAVRPYDKAIDEFSYYPYYATIVYPFVFIAIDDEMRKDYWKLSFLYWETMAVLGIFGSSGTYFVDKYRPYTYHPDTPMEKRTHGHGKNSFYAGHVQVTAGPTFFVAKIFSDYYPDSDYKWVHYGVASVATAAMAYMRLASGEHFPSEVLLGIGMGIGVGTLVPHFHKNRLLKNPDMSLLPVLGEEYKGLAFIYRMK